VSQVNRYLAEAELQPHRSKYWLNTKENWVNQRKARKPLAVVA